LSPYPEIKILLEGGIPNISEYPPEPESN